MKRALIVTSVASHALQFCMEDVRNLQAMGYEVDIASNFEQGISISDERCAAYQRALEASGIRWFQMDFSRAALALRTHIHAYHELRALLSRQYSLIHCHTPVGGALCRFAARHSGAVILYTAHGFHFFRGAPLSRWLLYYPIERLCARWTDVLITINHEDEAIARRRLRAKRIAYLPGVGIDLTRFRPGILSAEEREALRRSLGLGRGERLLLSVGELTPRKNHAMVLRALAAMNDPTLHYCVCGRGELERQLGTLAKSLGLGARVHLLGYREDVERLYACADLFVFPSRQEGLPVALMEAMACGLPALGARIRGNVELLDEGALFPPEDTRALSMKLRELLNADNTARIERNLRHIQGFSREIVSERMREIYEEATR